MSGQEPGGTIWEVPDVATVLEHLGDRAPEVVAGAGGLHRRVRQARLATGADDLRRAGPLDLVVATADALRAAGEPVDDVLRRLAGADVAALAVHASPGDLPAGAMTAADGLGLPLLRFPPAASVEASTTEVLTALLEAHRRRLARVLDIHQRFTGVALARGGIADIAATLHGLIQRPVLVVDDEHRPVAAAPADGPQPDGPDRPEGRRPGHPVRAAEHLYGYVVVGGDEPLDADQLIAVDRACTAIAVHLAQGAAVSEAQERFAAISLEELVSGHRIDDVAERAASFGWDLSRPRAVLLASVDPPPSGAVPEGALATIAAAARATLGRDAIVWRRSSSIAALLAPDTDDPAERRELAERLRRELDERLRSVTVSIGVGRRVPTAGQLDRSFVEASRAVDVGRWAKGRHVTEVFDQLGLERLFAATPAADLTAFVEHAIGPLADHDRRHRTELLTTLAVWLETRNMAEAARRMHVHYNTLKNRLDRIEQILGPILDDGIRALECEVAIYVHRHYDVAPSTTA